MLRENCLDVIGAHDAHMALDELAVLVELHRWNGSDVVRLGNLGIVRGVELDDVQKRNLRVKILENAGKQIAWSPVL